MYSMILLVAMGTTADAPAGGNRGMGCYGCTGYSGCCGGGGGCWSSGCWGAPGRYGCYGCTGGYGCYGSGCCGGMPGVAPRGAEMIPPPKDKGAPPPEAALAPAILLVHLPAEATLTINAVPTAQTAAPTRKFVSPPIEPGRDYYYLLQAEVVRGGQRWVTNSRVIVRSGEQSEVTLTVPIAALSQR